jgi:hypothetical protein
MRCKPISPLLALFLTIATVGPVAAQATPHGRMDVYVPPASDAGKWDGTWVYSSRDCRIGLWIRTVDGKPQMKLEYRSSQRPEVFETDWDTKASYYMAGEPARFAIEWSRRDTDRFEGKWVWEARLEDVSRRETSELSVYRTGDGRSLVFKFDNWERAFRRGDDVQSMKAPIQIWGFTKVSKRVDVLWDELPF